MKEYFENGRRVVEYDYEDWKQNRFSGEVGLIQVGNETYLCRIPDDQLELIRKRKKEIYSSRVETALSRKVELFIAAESKSDNKPEFRLQEEQKIKKYLDSSRVKPVYDKIIVRGERDYSRMKEYYPIGGHWNHDGSHEIEVEAAFRYQQWLKPVTNAMFSKTTLQNNGRKGGEVKGDNNYKKFQNFVRENSIDLSSYANTSYANIASSLILKGFSISKETARKYMKMYQEEQKG